MIRKEVKLGFAIGGVVLAVVVVWVLSVGGSSDHAKKQSASAGAKATDVASAKSITPSNDSLNNARPAVAAEPVAKADEVKTTDAQPTTAPSEAVAANSGNEPKKSGGDLDWGKLLNSDQPIPLSASNAQQTNTQASSPSPVSAGDPDAPAPVAPQAQPAPQAQTASVTDIPAAAPTAQPVAQNTQIAAAIPAPGTTPEVATPAPVPQAATETPTATPANVLADPAPVAPATQPARGARSHVVQKNETLSSIAAAAYGNANYYPHILRANPNLDPKRLKPGMSIVLPDVADVKPHDLPGGGETAHPAAMPAAAHTAATLDPTREYKVEARDSLQKISIKLYGKSDQWQKIYELNKDKIGADPAKVKQGMVLKLPAPPTVKVAKQG